MSEETSVVRRIGRYHAVGELGRGGMGVVYKGFDPVIGRTVALKTLGISGQDAEAKQLRERLYREASAAGTLTHPHIVTIYDVIDDGDTTAVAMEYVEGRSLADLLADGPLPLERALALFEEITAALDYAGAKGIVHRDIKPANILLTPDGHAKITDFGIARMAVSGLTQTGTIMGSPSYMSPEQVRGVPLDSRSDLFSAAVVLYEMLTGERPFGGDDVATTMYRIVNEPPKALNLVNVSIHPAVASVLERALAKNPADRFQRGADAVAELKRLLGMGPAAGAMTGAMTGGMTAGVNGGMTVLAELPPLPQAPMPFPQMSSLPLPAPIPPPAKSKLPLILAGGGAILVIGLIGLILLGKSSKRTEGGGTASQGVEIAATQDVSQAPPVSIPAPESAPTGASTQTSLSGPVSTVPPPPANLGLTSSLPPATDAPRPSASAPAPAARGTQGAVPASRPTAAEQPAAAPREVQPAPRDTTPPVRDMPPLQTPRADPPASRPPEPTPPAATAAPATPTATEAVLRIDFDGEAYPVTLFADDDRIGNVGGPGTLALSPGSVKIRAVAETVFLNADVAALTLKPGDRKTVLLPGLASAVLNVKGEDYTGVRILVDGRQIPGPYPAQLSRVAAGTHNVVYRWVSGPMSGREISKAVTFSARGHFLVRAVPDNADIVVQQLR